ncbi:protein SAR DEFICIENT 4-like [Triticum dicoccoides]|uniref:protein SAR DEFICIENT 4-like n=1 Tax=Triticum dicoccoides TaxID=85692 RepID=UPI000E7BB8DE|nr:protein SAR DEFICIENT 4-like [Triticum dicoccoides]
MAAPPSHPFVYIDAEALHAVLPFPSLISHLRAGLPAFSGDIHCPHRVSFPVPTSPSAALLLMPSWCAHPSLPYLALKAVTSFPANSPHRPSIHATVSLFSSASGVPLAFVDGSALTLLRTAAVSALAASLLVSPSRPPSTLALAGAGALAPYLAEAHLSALPSLSRILVWNRTKAKSAALVGKLRDAHPGVAVEEVDGMDEAVSAADIVSCATGSQEPIVRGELLKPGAHLDLVGSFTPAMRECDDEALRRGRVFIDFEAALEEAGELVGALQRGVLRRDDVAGTLAELAAGTVAGRRSDDEITVFKSVGTAVVDLLAAQLAYENYTAAKNA